ncbi:MAG TPA: hypothetical protein VGL22_05605 [Terracidiphilus sp.]
MRIPLRTVAAHETAQDSNLQLPDLAVSKGGDDEPPQGPDSFDVSADGGFLITDPLMQRLARYSSDGRFLQSVPLDFVPAGVTLRPDGAAEIKAAHSNDVFLLDPGGQIHRSESLPPREAAKVTSPHEGLVWRTAAGSDAIHVHLENPALTLLSLQLLAAGDDGSAYVALESTSGQSDQGIDVKKSVRRYSSGGKLISQTGNMPLDYYIAPNDELRVHKGIVYQLMTTASEVEINVWDLN